MDDNTEIVKKVIEVLYNDVAICQPLYCPEVKSESDGEEMSKSLPLVYIWNEDPSTGTCSISLNGPIVGETLEQFMPRSHEDFEKVRDKVMKIVQDAGLEAIQSTCEEMGVLPSVAFSKEQYLAMCKEPSS